MRLYELDIDSLWWIAAEDEMEAMNILRDELFTREISEEEMDAVMDDLTVNETLQEEAETISVGEDSADSLWSVFKTMYGPGLVYSDYHRDDEESDEELTYHEEGSLPRDWV